MTSLRSSILFLSVFCLPFSALGEPETQDETSREAALFGDGESADAQSREAALFGESQPQETKETDSKGQIETSSPERSPLDIESRLKARDDRFKLGGNLYLRSTSLINDERNADEVTFETLHLFICMEMLGLMIVCAHS